MDLSMRYWWDLCMSYTSQMVLSQRISTGSIHNTQNQNLHVSYIRGGKRSAKTKKVSVSVSNAVHTEQHLKML